MHTHIIDVAEHRLAMLGKAIEDRDVKQIRWLRKATAKQIKAMVRNQFRIGSFPGINHRVNGDVYKCVVSDGGRN